MWSTIRDMLHSNHPSSLPFFPSPSSSFIPLSWLHLLCSGIVSSHCLYSSPLLLLHLDLPSLPFIPNFLQCPMFLEAKHVCERADRISSHHSTRLSMAHPLFSAAQRKCDCVWAMSLSIYMGDIGIRLPSSLPVPPFSLLAFLFFFFSHKHKSASHFLSLCEHCIELYHYICRKSFTLKRTLRSSRIWLISLKLNLLFQLRHYTKCIYGNTYDWTLI